MVKSPYKSQAKCCSCKKVLKNHQNISRIGEKTISKVRVFANNDYIQISDFICCSCRKKLQRHQQIHSYTDQSMSSDLKIPSQTDRTDNSNSDDGDFSESIKKLDDDQNIDLNTAFSSHKRCFICKKKTKLRLIKHESIITAYKNYGIIIKDHSRCCIKHLDDTGQIKLDEFFKIPTKSKTYDKNAINMIDICLSNSDKIQYQLDHSSGIFDKFKDMASLEETLCFKITGWSKLQFERFSKHITNIRDTAGRTKEQLIAIYRYWLAKGIDQSSLAMLKSNTSQQQISHYLSQIRTAINDQFVPLYLGAHKGREFFLKHNTESVKVLHEFKNDMLAVIADGTYTRLEKSANNDFQYLSYSMQKSQNLLKPFIMCCANGYFIDCYGPFSANLNDAQILRYIMATDIDLGELFKEKEKIVFFLDRGFRDNYWELIKEGFKVHIPTCAQLEKSKTENEDYQTINRNSILNKNDKVLSTNQSGETRLVTKVRFVVENQVGICKVKEALDNIRNTVAGHIQIDYRICCAMWNFNMTPCVPDGKDSAKIAAKIRKRCLKRQNKLESLLEMKFTSTVKSTDISAIDDFPKMTLSQIKKSIVFGSYKIKQSFSYLEQIMHHGKVYILNRKMIEKYVTHTKVKEELEHSKILAVLIPSRHKRGKKWKPKTNTKKTDLLDPKNFNTYYKVFIQYVPIGNEKQVGNISLKSSECHIKRYICSCLAGHQVAGCCVHVTSIIHFLSRAKDLIKKDPQNIKFPSVHLNKIFVNTSLSEKPNDPRYIRHKRRKSINIPKEVDFYLTSESSSEISSDDESFSIKRSNNLTGIQKVKNITNTKKNKRQVPLVVGNSSGSRTGLRKKEPLLHNYEHIDNKIPTFVAHIPRWGGYFMNNEKKIKIINTCTIDNYLFALWVMSKLMPLFNDAIPKLVHTEAILDIIKHIDQYDWDFARQIWYEKVMKLNVTVAKGTINFYGSVENFFLKYMYDFQCHDLLQMCSSSCILNRNLIVSENASVLHFGKIDNQEIRIVTDLLNKCSACNRRVTCEVVFRNRPVFLFLETTSHLKLNELPQTITVENKTYKLLNVILHLNKQKHFITIFDFDGKKYLVDDLKSNEAPLLSENTLNNGINYFQLNISSALYYLS